MCDIGRETAEILICEEVEATAEGCFCIRFEILIKSFRFLLAL